MAELAGSIIGIVAAGTKVALVLSQLASDIGSAGQEARMMSSEIRTFCTILNTLQDTMGKIQQSDYYAHCSDMIRDMTDASLEMFTEILDAVEKLKGIVAGKDGKDAKFRLVSKVQWVMFQKPKILVLRAAIEAYKSNIALMLGTLNTVEKVARRISAPQHGDDTTTQDAQEQTILQSLELDSRSSLLNLEQAERQFEEHIDQALEHENDVSTEQLLDSNTEPAQDNLVSATQHWSGEVLRLARMEVNSVRLSFSSKSSNSSFERATLSAQLVQHSQRLSQVMEDDQKRLSQRWSIILDPQSTNHAEILLPQALDGVTSNPSVTGEPTGSMSIILHAAQYERFQTWFKDLTLEQQHEILRAIEKKVQTNNKKRSEAIIVVIKQQIATQGADGPRSYTIDLTRATLETVPLEVMDMMRTIHTLRRLSLSRNSLTTIHGSFGKYLRYLNLNRNKFTSIPDQVMQIPSLEILDMAGNSLRCIPKTISQLKNLKVLSLIGNSIQGIPLEIGNLKNLALLRLEKNPVIFPSLATRYYYRDGLPLSSMDEKLKDAMQEVKRATEIRNELRRYQKEHLSYNNAQAIAGELPAAVLERLLKMSPSASIEPSSPRNHQQRSSTSDWLLTNAYTGVDKEHPSPRNPIEREIITAKASKTLEIPRLAIPRSESSTSLLSPPKHSLYDHRRSRSQGDESGAARATRHQLQLPNTMDVEKRYDHSSLFTPMENRFPKNSHPPPSYPPPKSPAETSTKHETSLDGFLPGTEDWRSFFENVIQGREVESQRVGDTSLLAPAGQLDMENDSASRRQSKDAMLWLNLGRS